MLHYQTRLLRRQIDKINFLRCERNMQLEEMALRILKNQSHCDFTTKKLTGSKFNFRASKPTLLEMQRKCKTKFNLTKLELKVTSFCRVQVQLLENFHLILWQGQVCFIVLSGFT